MNRKNAFFSLILAFVVLTLTVSSCKEDEPQPIKLASMTAGTIDLNGAIAPSNVPVEPVIVATFTENVDAATATAANIKMVQNYDTTDIELDITVSGASITITPADPLGSGTLYQLAISSSLLSTDGLSIGDLGIKRTFTTAGTFVPKGQIAHWNFEDNANDQVGAWNPKVNGVIDITYVASRNSAAGKAAAFNGTSSIIEYANGDDLITTSSITISFWMKGLTQDHDHFVMGLGAFHGFKFELGANFKYFKANNGWRFSNDLTRGISDLEYNGDGKTKDNGGWRGTIFNKENAAVDGLLKDKWALITYTFNSNTKHRSFYINGSLVKAEDFDLWISDEGTRWDESYINGVRYVGVAPEVLDELAFGFIQSRGGTLWDAESWGGYDFPGANHFKGQLDDVRIYHKALTPTEITLMYNSEKP